MLLLTMSFNDVEFLPEMLFFILFSFSFFFLGTCGVLAATFLYGMPERTTPQPVQLKPV